MASMALLCSTEEKDEPSARVFSFRDYYKSIPYWPSMALAQIRHVS